MDEKEYILQKQFRITSRDADFKCDLRLSALINLYIQAAWQHAEILGFGYDHLNAQQLGWALSRLKLKIIKLPSWPGTIVVNTWPKGLNRLFYMRDAEFSDGQGNPFASVTSGWLVFDMNTRRPKLLEAKPASLFHNENLHAINETIPALKFDGEPILSASYHVRYNDIDMNQHLTAMRYIEFMTDTYDISFLKTHQPAELIVNYLKEITFGTELIMHRYGKGLRHGFELVNATDDTVCFRGELTFVEG